MDGFLKKAKGKLEKFIDTELNPGQSAPQSQHNYHQQNLNSQERPSHPPGQQFSCGVEHDQPSSIQEPTALDILRYRYHHGTNLGSIFVIERWLRPSRFPDGASGSSELAAVQAWADRIGIDATKLKFEEYWANAVTDADIYWLVNEAKCTAVRLPIGYYDLPDPSFTQGTPFKPYAYVYSSAWYSIRTLISRLRANGIGTLIDLHALPGGANKGEHSGTNRGIAGLWTSSVNRELGLRCCQYLACEVKSGLEILGIQIVNEADWESERMYDWYDDCIAAISAIDPTVPVIISDGWDLAKTVEYCLGKNEPFPSQPTCPVVIDTHCYWAFTDADKQKSPQQIITEVDTKMSELARKEGSVIDRGAVQVIIGEYSVVLTEDSWQKCCGVPKEDLIKQFGEAQSKRYQQRAGGAFFWTWKMDWMPGGEWGFKKQSDPKTRSLNPPTCSLVPHCDVYGKLERANHCRNERMQTAINQHVSYWSRTSPNTQFEHWRYEYGWKVGYNDAYLFFSGRQAQAVGPANKIGNLELWALKRIRDCGFRGKFVWEFEQGLRKGIQDFNDLVGI